MTVDDQLQALAPLSPGVVAFLAGYNSSKPSQAVWQLRRRGQLIPAERLRLIADQLEALAEIAREVANHSEGRRE